jgi:hypothetical protein
MATRSPTKKTAPVRRTAAKKAAPAKESAAERAAAAKAPQAGGAQESPEVVAFLRALVHPHKAQVEAVRRLVLGVDPSVRESLKWNAPSFSTREHFATFHLRGKEGVQLVLHTGAKVRETAKTGVKVEDPAGLLTWLAPDRCMVRLADAADVARRGPALQALLREWIRHV